MFIISHRGTSTCVEYLLTRTYGITLEFWYRKRANYLIYDTSCSFNYFVLIFIGLCTAYRVSSRESNDDLVSHETDDRYLMVVLKTTRLSLLFAELNKIKRCISHAKSIIYLADKSIRCLPSQSLEPASIHRLCAAVEPRSVAKSGWQIAE